MVMIKYTDKEFYLSNILKDNLDEYKRAVFEKNTSVVICCDGRSGLGKTTLSFQLACFLNPNGFNLNWVCFTPEQFIEALKKAKKGDVVIFDEAMILSSRSAMSMINKAIVMMMAQIRSKQIFVIFNINSIFDLDKNLSMFRTDMLLHIYSEGGKIGGRRRYMVFPSTKGKLKNLIINGKKYYSYRKPRAVLHDHFSKFFPLNEREYEKKKQKAISEFMGKGKDKGSKARAERNRYMLWIKETNPKITQHQLSDIGKINIKTVAKGLDDAKKEEEE